MYQLDRTWADTYSSQVIDILKTLIQHCVVISIASSEDDNKRATDFTIQLTGGSIAVRLRRSDCTFRDLTIRAHRKTGVKTELAKIKEGHAFRYFYGWMDDKDNIVEWILVDLDKVRMARLLEKERRFIANGDGTWFIAISTRELAKTECLLEYHLKEIPVVEDFVSIETYDPVRGYSW